jgi:hypothetical protein
MNNKDWTDIMMISYLQNIIEELEKNEDNILPKELGKEEIIWGKLNLKINLEYIKSKINIFHHGS